MIGVAFRFLTATLSLISEKVLMNLFRQEEQSVASKLNYRLKRAPIYLIYAIPDAPTNDLILVTDCKPLDLRSLVC